VVATPGSPALPAWCWASGPVPSACAYTRLFAVSRM
jgi:hypothetical protein